MSEIKLWHVLTTGVLSAILGIVITIYIMSLNHWKNGTEGAIRGLISEVERVDKNTQAIMGYVTGRSPRGGNSGVSGGQP